MANILVVDDENAMLQLIKRILEKDAHIVKLQADAKAVLDMDFRRYDLILLDVMMPDVNGFELCNQIRKATLFVGWGLAATITLPNLLAPMNCLPVSMHTYAEIPEKRNTQYLFQEYFFTSMQRKRK